jgi:hypothetical protein
MLLLLRVTNPQRLHPAASYAAPCGGASIQILVVPLPRETFNLSGEYPDLNTTWLSSRYPRSCRQFYGRTTLDAVEGATFPFSLKDLRRSDSCFDPWINLPASAIKRTVFLFSSSTLCRNNEDSSSILCCDSKDSSSCCDLAMPCVLVSSKRWPSDAELSDCTKDRRPERGTAEGCVKGLLQCNAPNSDQTPGYLCKQECRALLRGGSWCGSASMEQSTTLPLASARHT